MTHLNINNAFLIPIAPKRMRMRLPINANPLPTQLLHSHIRSLQMRVLAQQECPEVQPE